VITIFPKIQRIEGMKIRELMARFMKTCLIISSTLQVLSLACLCILGWAL